MPREHEVMPTAAVSLKKASLITLIRGLASISGQTET
jgi:hypothetical protein